MNYLFLSTNFALKLQGKCWKDDVTGKVYRPSSDVLSVWSRQKELVERSKLIQTNLTEPDVELFINLTH